MTSIGSIAQQGAISTQVASAVNSVPIAAEAPVVAEASSPPPPPPPVESGRGATIDVSA